MSQATSQPPAPPCGEAIIRPATANDLKAISRLSRLWESEGSTRGLIRDTPRRLRKHLGPLFLVAETPDGEIIGFAYASQHVADRNCTAVFDVGTPYIEIENIYVVCGWRGREIGSRLLAMLLEEAQKCDADRAIAFSSSVDWQQVVAFYARHGFKMWFFQMFK